MAKSILDHFNKHPTTQPTPTTFHAPSFSPSSSSSESEDDNTSTAKKTKGNNYNHDAKPIIATLLEGERERIYWMKLPEIQRRNARNLAKGPVGLVGSMKTNGETTKTDGERDGKRSRADEEEEVTPKRKKPSKLT